MEGEALTFKALNARIDALEEHPSTQIASTRRQRWGYFIGFGAGFAGLIGGKLLPDSRVATVYVCVMLLLEIIALAIAMVPARPWHLPGFAKERRDFADQLDFDLVHYQALIDWLQHYPTAQLEAMATYAEDRLERLKEKHPLLTGGLEKLGALPVLAALYLQFRNMQWPPQATWVEIIFGIVLVYAYGSCLLLVGVRFRAQLFATMLRRAAQQAANSSTLAPGANPTDTTGDVALESGNAQAPAAQ